MSTADSTDATDQAGDELRDELEAARPAGGLERKHLRARLGAALFGEPAEPVRLGRFVTLDRLGAGGMGVVYSAYDPQLERRVTLKLLRAGSGLSGAEVRERLLREAQALARLSHPNVVPVHDVGVLDEQVFIVMEFIVGQTLRAWQEAEERSWRQVLEVYLQAGRGLVAAHAVGLVHRDFKPDNALIGADGRVRVIDFGLARGNDMAPVAPAARDGEPPSAVEASLTRTGARLGTPAFMSPEQFASARVGPRSDQFSFCASLFEALYGISPFAGDTAAEREREVRAGRLREPRRGRVPGWLLPILSRGLRADPAQRHPSMSALLAALQRDAVRKRQRRLLALGALLFMGLVSYALVRMGSLAGAPVCQGGERAMAEVWSAERRARVERALLATGRPYAAPAWARVAETLEGYAADWARMHRDACMAHHRGEQSDLLLDRRMACLERRRDAMRSALTVLEETGPESLQYVVDVAQSLPAIAYCGRVEALAAEVPPPEDARVARQVEALRQKLSRADALEHAGRHPEGLAAAHAVAEAAAPLGYRPLVAEAALIQGRLALSMRSFPEAARLFERAIREGLAAGLHHVAVEAMARRIYAVGMDSPQSSENPVYLSLGEALGEGLTESVFERALLFNNAGAASLARGERDAARQHFERALAIKKSATQVLPVELANISRNLALVTPDEERRALLLQDALEEFAHALGEHHPETLSARRAAAHYRSSPARAYALLVPACAGYESYHPERTDELTACLFHQGLLEAELGLAERAAAHMQRTAELLATAARTLPRERLRELARGHALLYRGEHEAALVPLRAARDGALAQSARGWWLERDAAQARLALGVSALALGQRAEAIAELEQALPVLEHLVTLNENSALRFHLARTRASLAMALWPAGGGEATRARRARALLTAAERWYAEAGGGYEERLAELARWRREHGLAP